LNFMAGVIRSNILYMTCLQQCEKRSQSVLLVVLPLPPPPPQKAQKLAIQAKSPSATIVAGLQLPLPDQLPEGLYCKRPIQCLASSEILKPPPPPPSPPGECVTLRLWCGGRTHSLGGEGVGRGSIVRKTPDTALYSIYVPRKYFVDQVQALPHIRLLLARGLLLHYLEALAEELIPPSPPIAGGHSFQEHEAPLVIAEVRASDRDSGAFGQVFRNCLFCSAII
jgi:hypothetical protein